MFSRISLHQLKSPIRAIFSLDRSPDKAMIQADALKLVASKLQSSLALEGDLPEDGLAS